MGIWFVRNFCVEVHGFVTADDMTRGGVPCLTIIVRGLVLMRYPMKASPVVTRSKLYTIRAHFFFPPYRGPAVLRTADDVTRSRSVLRCTTVAYSKATRTRK